MSDLEVLHCDNHLLAVAKPAGLPTVPDESGDESLLDLARRHIEVEFQKPGRAFLGVVQRLDRPVSGVVLFARTSKAAARLTDTLRERRARKTYLAVTARWPADEGGQLSQWLLRDNPRRRVSVAREGQAGAVEARTRWRVLQRFEVRESERTERRALIELIPETGRKHQLRLAMSSLGQPLLGDLKYGARAPLPDKSIALHALRLELEHPVRREPLCLEVPPPERPWWPQGPRE